MSATPKRKFPSQGALDVRNATLEDAAEICALSARAYASAGLKGYPEAMIEAQIRQFPEGQFVVVSDGQIIGYCATFMIDGEFALAPHSWAEITGGGYASRHDPDGEYLYGMEVCVDPRYRGFRIGQRLYNERRKLCHAYGLKGIVFAGRIPTLGKRMKQVGSVEAYLAGIQKRKYRDPVIMFQLRNGFEVVGVLENYLPSDVESLGFAVHMLWRNPNVPEDRPKPAGARYGGRLSDTVRVATVQYMQRRVTSFEEFLTMVEYFVDVVAEYKADFIVYPELFSLQLLSMVDDGRELKPHEAIESLTKYTPRLRDSLLEMAVRYNVNIIGGSHPTRMESGRVENICYVCLRDGSLHEQAKIHPTPNESHWWNIEGGHELKVMETDCGPIAVLICYDSEFPELARHVVDQGANIIFVPFCTDERQSYLRVRYCCQARAVENQCYVVMSGNVGNLPRVANMDIQYAQSCILTPCDFPFARDGIAADTTPNVETVAFADLRLESLRMARRTGTVRNLMDRRHDLYHVVWEK
jgi:predicted amidohydrolase/GNAT superfamily N-acetyltransferase